MSSSERTVLIWRVGSAKILKINERACTLFKDLRVNAKILILSYKISIFAFTKIVLDQRYLEMICALKSSLFQLPISIFNLNFHIISSYAFCHYNYFLNDTPMIYWICLNFDTSLFLAEYENSNVGGKETAWVSILVLK